MRKLQIALLILGVIAFAIAAANAGAPDGDTYWRVGVALLLLDIVLHQLWPTRSAATVEPHSQL
jgi:hypothetical protein